MIYTLRKYQELASDAGQKSLVVGKRNEVITVPTAGGKSIIISEIVHRLNEPTLILQPNKEILEQNYEKLRSYGVEDIGIYSASMNRKDIDKFTYATINSIYKKPELFRHFKKVIIDECHLVNPKGFGMYKKFFRDIGGPSILGLTATPYRLVQSYLKEGEDTFYTSKLQVLNRIHPYFFRSFCFNVTNKRLFEEGYLAPIDYVYPQSYIDISSIKLNSSGSDFSESEMDLYMMSQKNVRRLVDAIISNDDLPNNLIFCSSIRHAYASAELLSKLGYDCEVLTGQHSQEDRSRIISDFRSGKIKRLLNYNVLTTGFDYPGLYGITSARPTISLGLYYQMLGRGIRLDPNNPDKRCRFIDITSCSKRMGRIETIKLTKDGFKDQVETEVGVISGKPLFKFLTNKN